MIELTDRQLEILRSIKDYIELKGFAPSFRELGAAFKVQPPSIWQHVKALKTKGMLTMRPKTARTIVLTPAGEFACRVETASTMKVAKITSKSIAKAIEDIGPAVQAPTVFAQRNVAGMLEDLLAKAAKAGQVSDFCGLKIFTSSLVPERNDEGELVAWLFGRDGDGKEYITQLVLE